MSSSYENAGVSVEAGYRSVNLMKEHVRKTFSDNVLTDIGSFGGMFSVKELRDMDDPVLVSGTDGVGTKLKIAFTMRKYDTIGIDCVAMCVNDIICSGAKPLFFLDYIACGKNIPERIAEIVKGVSDGCIQSGCALIGGETAEMPDFYQTNEYDIAGFAVGVVDKNKIIDGKNISVGDTVIGIASSGLHSNGYSLVRKLLRPSNENVNEFIGVFDKTLGEELMMPTKIYVNTVMNLIKDINVKGIANITGGGFFENIPRILPEGLCADINTNSFKILPIFDYIMNTGSISRDEMFNVFNMGIGMVFVVSEEDEEKTIKNLEESGETAYIIGKIKKGNGITI